MFLALLNLFQLCNGFVAAVEAAPPTLEGRKSLRTSVEADPQAERPFRRRRRLVRVAVRVGLGEAVVEDAEDIAAREEELQGSTAELEPVPDADMDEGVGVGPAVAVGEDPVRRIDVPGADGLYGEPGRQGLGQTVFGVEVELMLGDVGKPRPRERFSGEGVDGFVLEVEIGIGQPQGQVLGGIPGQGRLEAVAVGRADVAVEGLEGPGDDPIAAEIVLRAQVEEGDVIAQGLADRAPRPDLLAARRGRDEPGVVPAERVGVVDELFGPGWQEARPPAGVEAEVGERVPGDAEPSRRPLVSDVPGQVNPAGLDTVVELVGNFVVADARGDAPPQALKLIDFVKSKKPKLITLETRRDKASYQRLYGITAQVLKGINQKVYFPRSSFWCKDCEYAEPCRTWQSS